MERNTMISTGIHADSIGIFLDFFWDSSLRMGKNGDFGLEQLQEFHPSPLWGSPQFPEEVGSSPRDWRWLSRMFVTRKIANVGHKKMSETSHLRMVYTVYMSMVMTCDDCGMVNMALF